MKKNKQLEFKLFSKWSSDGDHILINAWEAERVINTILKSRRRRSKGDFRRAWKGLLNFRHFENNDYYICASRKDQRGGYSDFALTKPLVAHSSRPEYWNDGTPNDIKRKLIDQKAKIFDYHVRLLENLKEKRKEARENGKRF